MSVLDSPSIYALKKGKYLLQLLPEQRVSSVPITSVTLKRALEEKHNTQRTPYDREERVTPELQCILGSSTTSSSSTPLWNSTI